MIKELNLKLNIKAKDVKKPIYPKKNQKNIFNPFEIDLTSNVDKILKVGRKSVTPYQPSRRGIIQKNNKTTDK